MPASKKLPTAKEMEDWVLVALQEPGREAHFRRIDSKVKEMLVTSGVSKREANRVIKHIRGTSHNLKTSGCRTILRQQGFLEKINRRGFWRLTEKGEVRANAVRAQLNLKPATAPLVNGLAKEVSIRQNALEVLRKNNVSEEIIREFLEELLRSKSVRAHPDSTEDQDNLEVEATAINFIVSQPGGKGWHRTPAANPGFDLYKTESGRKNGKKTLWCEVKSLTGKFNGISLTPTEFLKAQECGDSYWLYVVEYAMSDNPSLIRIKNPGGAD